MSRGNQSTDAARTRIEALSHELRLMIAMVLSVEAASATEVAEQLGESADKIRYQLRRLRDAGLIEVTEERHRRGVVERIYAAREEKMDFSFEESVTVSKKIRSRFALHLLRVIFKTSFRALSEGAMVEKERTLISMVPMRVDLRGWEELARFHREALDRVLQLKAESDQRLKVTGGPSIPASSILLWLKNPTGE